MQDVIPNQIFVTGYSRSKYHDEREVKDLFREFGQIKSIVYKGHYSFLTFNNEQDAERAIKEMHEKSLHGNKLKVEIVDNRRTKKTGPSKEDECFKCKRKGHWARDCTYQERSRSRSHRRRRQHERSRSRSNRRRRSPSSRSSSVSSSRSHRNRKRRSHSRDRNRRKQRRDSRSYSRRHRRRSSSRSSRRTKSRSPSKSPRGKSQSNSFKK